MALYKDGNVYRTYEEQVDHLTDAHNNQLTFNANVSKQLQDLATNVSLGGYALVRFAFQTSGGTFYHYNSGTVVTIPGLTGTENDYVEFSTGSVEDIPAYGFFNSDNQVVISYGGDFREQNPTIEAINITKNTSATYEATLTAFNGTSLNDFNPNNVKKQVFNVINDLRYNAPTQYVSYDINGDGVYNFVFIGPNKEGEVGTLVYVYDGTNYNEIKQKLRIEQDYILFGVNGDSTNIPDISTGIRGDLYTATSIGNYKKVGSILGNKGDKGDTGTFDTPEATANTLEPGQNATVSITSSGLDTNKKFSFTFGIPKGEKGDKGDKGDTGAQGNPGTDGLKLHDGILNNPSELPDFATAEQGDAYTVINTSTSTTTYDLYYKAVDGSTWSVLPNWGGVPGPKGDKGDTGAQGNPGIQGEKGNTGATGKEALALNTIVDRTWLANVNDVYELSPEMFNRTPEIGEPFYGVVRYDNSLYMVSFTVGSIGETNGYNCIVNSIYRIGSDVHLYNHNVSIGFKNNDSEYRISFSILNTSSNDINTYDLLRQAVNSKTINVTGAFISKIFNVDVYKIDFEIDNTTMGFDAYCYDTVNKAFTILTCIKPTSILDSVIQIF